MEQNKDEDLIKTTQDITFKIESEIKGLRGLESEIIGLSSGVTK